MTTGLLCLASFLLGAGAYKALGMYQATLRLRRKR